MGNRGGQETPVDGNGKGSEHDDNKGDEESEVNFPEGVRRQWTQQSTKY
jgi:hypothetical protein